MDLIEEMRNKANGGEAKWVCKKRLSNNWISLARSSGRDSPLGWFLKKIYKKTSFLKTFVLGISGGDKDSTLAGRLAQLAMEEMRSETGVLLSICCSPSLWGTDRWRRCSKSFDLYPARCQPGVNIKGQLMPWNALSKQQERISPTSTRAISRLAVAWLLNNALECAVEPLWDGPCSGKYYRFLHKIWNGGADIYPFSVWTSAKGKQLLKALGASHTLCEKIPTADLEENQECLTSSAGCHL